MDIRDLLPWAASRPPGEVRGEGEHPLRSLQGEMNRVFDGLVRSFPGASVAAEMGPFWGGGPRVDVVESDAAVEVTAELPGLGESDVEVSLDGDVLTIKGEKKAHSELQRLNVHISERAYGSFRRSIPLPAGIDTDSAAASFRNGVLTITIAKTQEAAKEGKQIPVKGE